MTRRMNRIGAHSRLTLQFMAISMAFLGVFSLSTYWFAKWSGIRATLARAREDITLVKEYIRLAPAGSGENGRLPGDVMFLVEEYDKIVYHSEAMAQAFLKGLVIEPAQYLNGGVWRSSAGHKYSLLSDSFTTSWHYYVITVATDLAPLNAQLSTLAFVLMAAFCASSAISAAMGYWFTGRALAPLGEMAEKALRITVDNLAERLPVANPRDELGRLATVFNGTLDRLERSFAGLTAFTADVSHELRTPLTAIRSVGEVALRTAGGAIELRDAIGSMLEEADRLSGLVDDMLVLARADSGEAAAHSSPVSVGGLIRTALDLLSVLAEERDQSVIADIGSQAVCRVDENSMLRAFINIIDNAIRYTPKGGEIRLSALSGVNGRIVVELDDEAPVIPREERERVFTRFHRLDPGRDRATGGAGLGLAITKKTVEAHGGKVYFTDKPSGNGNRCVIELPGVR